MTTMTGTKAVKLETRGGEILIEDIEEYVCGFQYFYVRHRSSGETLSFNRDNIVAVSRRLPGGEFRPIHMKKPKVYEMNGGQDE